MLFHVLGLGRAEGWVYACAHDGDRHLHACTHPILRAMRVQVSVLANRYCVLVTNVQQGLYDPAV